MEVIEQSPNQIALSRIAPTGLSSPYYFIFQNSHEIQLDERKVAFTAQKIERKCKVKPLLPKENDRGEVNIDLRSGQ